MSMAEVMDGLAGLAAGLAPTVHAYPPGSVTPPSVVVGYPDITYQRETTYRLPVWFLVGAPDRRESRDALFAILTDAVSIKASLDGAHAFGDVRVTDVAIEEVAVAAVTHLAATFQTEVYA